MEGTGDSHSELMHRAQTFLGASSRSSSESSPSSSSIAVGEDAGAPFFNQLQQAAFKSHSHNRALSQHQGKHSSYSSLFQQYPQAQDASYHQARPLLQLHSHSRSVSQPSSFFQSLWQSSSLHHGASVPYPEGILTMKTKDEAICAAVSPSSEPSYKATSPSEVSMSEQETSSTPSISGHSIPPLPPLSPSPNTYQSAMKKHSTDLNQVPLEQMMRKGHRRSLSEVPLGFSAGKECSFGRPLSFGQNEASVDEVPLLELNRSSSISRKEMHRVSGRMVMEVVGEREGEGVDDPFSMCINVDKSENHHDIGVADGGDRADNAKLLKKRGVSGAPFIAEYVKTLARSLQELSDSDKEESDKEEDCFLGDSNERVIKDCSQRGETAKGEACSSRHQRSVSMDNLTHSMIGGDEAQHCNVASHSRSVRHHHSLSIDGSFNTKLRFLSGEVDGLEMKKIMANDKLAEIALLDPKRAKRILANRQSAARSKERKVRYISELERKVLTLQTEATALSAQLTLMQRDSTALTNENNELKLRLQSMEQQAQLREALHEALSDEVQRLKVATGQISGQALNHQFFQMAHQSARLTSQQVEQHPQPHLQEQSQAFSSSLHQSSTQMQH